MKLITFLRNSLFPVIARQNKQILTLQDELSGAVRQYQELVAKQKELLTEIEYLYYILVHRNGYRYRLLVFPKLPPLLFTAGGQGDKPHFILYIPSECTEIASLAARRVGRTLVMEEMEINQVVFENKHTGTVLVQQIITEARVMGIEQITGSSGIAADARFSETVRVGEVIGLSLPYIAQ